MIMAAQKQALSTISIEAGVYHIKQDPKCRLCSEASEKIQHAGPRYKTQAGTEYTEQHNQVAGVVYRNICKVYGLDPDGRFHRKSWRIRRLESCGTS